jgi:3-oxoacyl-[acyl-carrier protein] reductase
VDLDLGGKKVLVSAATRGVGRAIAARFLDEGCIVSICGRRTRNSDPNAADPSILSNPLGGDGVEEAVETLGKRGTIYGSVVDCGDYDQVARWVGRAAAEMRGIDIVVSCASALGGIPRSPKGWDISYHIDLKSSVAMWDAAYPFLKGAAPSSFVQLGTITAFENHTFVGSGFSYGAMKAAVINYVHQLALEFMGEGIRCNSVSPGPIYMKGGSWDFLKNEMPDYFAANLARQPAGRFGRPEEVADAVAFLASPRASWITGVNLTVDGGFTRNTKY